MSAQVIVAGGHDSSSLVRECYLSWQAPLRMSSGPLTVNSSLRWFSHLVPYVVQEN